MPAIDVITIEEELMVVQGRLFRCPKLPYPALLFCMSDWLVREFPTCSVAYWSIFHFVKRSRGTGNADDKQYGRLSVLSDDLRQTSANFCNDFHE
jgi:hypothetical protein